MPELPDIEKIIEQVTRELGIDPHDIDINVPPEFESLEQALRLVKETYLKEISAEINNKLTAAYTAADKLAKNENLSPEFIELAVKDLQRAVDLLQKLKGHS